MPGRGGVGLFLVFLWQCLWNKLQLYTCHQTSLRHRFRQALANCFVLLVRQLTIACEASHHASDKQPKASVKQAKASVKHIKSIWQTSAKHLTDVCLTPKNQKSDRHLSDALYLSVRCFVYAWHMLWPAWKMLWAACQMLDRMPHKQLSRWCANFVTYVAYAYHTCLGNFEDLIRSLKFTLEESRGLIF